MVGGVLRQGSEAGEPLIRQTKPGWVATWVTEKPAALRAASPDPGSPGAHETVVEPP